MKPYFKEIIKEGTPTLVLFIHADIKDNADLKYLEENIKNKYVNKLNFEKVDVSYDRHLIEEYKINEYPTWILFEKGEELMRESGEKSFNELAEMIDRAL